MMNTLQRGAVRYIVFKEDGLWYAAGLEFNIVESGDSPQEAMLLLFEALRGYVESARKIKARPQILNQKADEQYETLWNQLEDPERNSTPSLPVYTHGSANVGSRTFLTA